MAKFNYTARDRSGQATAADIEAPSRKEVLRLLAARGLSPLSVNEAPAANAKRPSETVRNSGTGDLPRRTAGRIPRSPVVISRKQRLPFLQALSDLTGSGLSAGEAVRLLSQRLQEPALRALCQGLWERLSEGQPLSRAMEEYGNVFDTSTTSLIQAGEATGSLNDVLQRLIQHFTEQREVRQKLMTAMAYPVFICAMATGVITISRQLCG